MVEWERIEIEMPTLDEDGNRLERAADGTLRPTEMVPYEPLKDLSFRLNQMATVEDRSWLEATLDDLYDKRGLSFQFAANFLATKMAVCTKYVLGVRVGDDEKLGPEVAQELAAALDYNDALIFMNWLKRKARLSSAKKKNWKQLFGLGT